MIFETHAHYDDQRYTEDREALLASLPAKGIGRIINVGASVETTKAALQLAGAHTYIYAAVGVHPSEVGGLNEESFAWLSAQTENPKVAAVGEIGLDYYWEKEEEVRECQRYWFRRQLELAAGAGLPVIIHSRDAAEDTMRILREAGVWETGVERNTVEGGAVCGVIHCYSYSPEMAEEFVRMGYAIGVGGVVTFKNAKKLKETVQRIPLQRLLLETDCPYMAPEPHRGERNDSSYLPYVAEKVAELKGISREEVERVTWENAAALFPKSGKA